MFEQELHEMAASIFIEDGIYQLATSSNVALFHPEDLISGDNNVTFHRAVELIRKMDERLPYVQKTYFKRLRALRNQFVFAFGPEMESFLRTG